jgi:hydrogenase expression/formation protein HypC
MARRRRKMCIAMPGKIVELDGMKAKVDFKGTVVNVNVGLIEAKVGDYALVHAGCAIEIMEKDKAVELIELFESLEM